MDRSRRPIFTDDIDGNEHQLTAGAAMCPTTRTSYVHGVVHDTAGCSPAAPATTSDLEAPATATVTLRECRWPQSRCCAAQLA